MHKPPLAIVFDCFGVIYQDAFLQFMEQYKDRLSHPDSYYYDLSDASDKGQLSPEVLYGEFAADSGLSVPEVRAMIEENVASLNQETVEIIQELKHKYRLGLLSNISRDFLDHFLALDNVKHLFDSILASSEVGYLKPSREIFTAMADRLHVPYNKWLFIDDRIKNIRGASAHGIHSHHFTSAAELRTYLRYSGVLSK